MARLLSFVAGIAFGASTAWLGAVVTGSLLGAVLAGLVTTAVVARVVRRPHAVAAASGVATGALAWAVLVVWIMSQLSPMP